MKKKDKVWIPVELIESRAWQALKKPSAFRVLLRFYQKIQVENKNANHKRKKFEPVNLDEGTWKKYRKLLLPYGLNNAPGIGYFIKK